MFFRLPNGKGDSIPFMIVSDHMAAPGIPGVPMHSEGNSADYAAHRRPYWRRR